MIALFIWSSMTVTAPASVAASSSVSSKSFRDSFRPSAPSSIASCACVAYIVHVEIEALYKILHLQVNL